MNKTYAKYLLALMLFGFNGIVASRISLTSYEIVLLRTGIGSLLLLAIFFLSGRKVTCLANKGHFLYLAASGASMGASWMFLYEAYAQIGVSIASLLYYCGPVIVMALSPLLFKEKLTKAKAVGFFIVLCGLMLVNAHAQGAGGSKWGFVCGGLSAAMYAAMVMLNKKAKSIVGLENAAVQLACSFFVVALFVGCKQGFAMQIDGGDWPPILALGLLNTGLGCYLYFSSIGKLPIQTVAICGYLEPLSAVVFSVLLLGESLRPLQVVGAALIIGGAVLGELSNAQRHRS